MPHEVAAFPRREQLKRPGDEVDDLVEGARSSGAQEGFQLRKRELDRIEIRTVGREKAQPGADAFDGDLHRRLLVHGQVVEHDDVARLERRHQDFVRRRRATSDCRVCGRTPPARADRRCARPR